MLGMFELGYAGVFPEGPLHPLQDYLMPKKIDHLLEGILVIPHGNICMFPCFAGHADSKLDVDHTVQMVRCLSQVVLNVYNKLVF